MPPSPSGTPGPNDQPPSMLDLIRLSRRPLFPPGGEDLYRQIALLTDMSEGKEVLDVSCGKGVQLEYFVRGCHVNGSGVDIDPGMIEAAEERCRASGLGDRLQFQTGRADALPYRDRIFDISIGELGLASRSEPADAVSELVRVTKPGGSVVLIRLVWKAPVDEARRRVLGQHLGARPMMLVEWKRVLAAAAVEEVHAEDWTEGTSFRNRQATPFPDFAQMFSFPEKLGILRRAWVRWGWDGVLSVLQREREVHRLLTRERILGLYMLRGRRSAAQMDARDEAAKRHTETTGLPLFGPEPERS